MSVIQRIPIPLRRNQALHFCTPDLWLETKLGGGGLFYVVGRQNLLPHNRSRKGEENLLRTGKHWSKEEGGERKCCYQLLCLLLNLVSEPGLLAV